MIDISNLDKLTPEQRGQFNSLLEHFPHLGSKMETSRELNTPSKLEEDGYANMMPTTKSNSEELDYSHFMEPIETPKVDSRRDLIPQLKVNENNSSFRSMEQEEAPPPRTQPELDAIKEERAQQRIETAVKAGQPYEVASFRGEGKPHPILQKMRATVGLRSVQDPVVVNLGGCDYHMRPLDRSHVAQASVLAIATTTNNMLYETNLEAAIVAYAVVAIDRVPLTDIFSIASEDTVDGRTVKLDFLQRETKAAEAFYIELLKSPNELVESLSIYYQQEFPPLNLMGAGKAKFLCPAEACMQSRIADLDATCFCPVHGKKMAREDLLPNPL